MQLTEHLTPQASSSSGFVLSPQPAFFHQWDIPGLMFTHDLTSFSPPPPPNPHPCLPCCLLVSRVPTLMLKSCPLPCDKQKSSCTQ